MREGLELYRDIGESPAELRQALIELRREFEARKDSDYQKLVSLIVSNISISAGGPDTPIGTIGRDPQSQNIWGYIAERGYGFHARYQGANYARFFVDATNDLGHTTPSAIMDMPTPNKFVFKDNESITIYRVYGGHGQEVGFATNYFDSFSSDGNGGAFDLFVPFRLYTHNYAGGTAGGPEGQSGYSQQGFMYYRQNYGASLIDDLRVFDGSTWKSVRTYHPEADASPGNPFAADTIAVRELVTVTIA
jgi:hypothetical protein